MTIIKKAGTALTLVLVLILTNACSAPPEQPLRLGTNVWPGYEPLFLARDLEQWPENEIRLIEYPSASEVLRAFRNRTLEAAALTLDETLRLRELNIPIAIILVNDISAGGDVIMARPPITEMKTLKGKRVAVESGALGAYMVTRALEKHGLTLEDIEIYHMGVNLHETAYKDNTIDAAVMFEPYRTRLLSQGANEIFTSREIPDEIIDVVVVHKDTINEKPEVLQKLVNGWFKTLVYMKEHQQQAAEKISTRLKISPQEVIASYEGLILPDRNGNQAFLSGDMPKIMENLKKLNQIMAKNQFLNQPVTIEDMVDDQFITSGPVKP